MQRNASSGAVTSHYRKRLQAQIGQAIGDFIDRRRTIERGFELRDSEFYLLVFRLNQTYPPKHRQTKYINMAKGAVINATIAATP
jgi:hypothetical protein